MLRSYLLSTLALIPSLLFAQSDVIRVGLLRDHPPSEVTVSCKGGPMDVLVDGRVAGQLNAREGLRMSIENGHVTAHSPMRSFPAARMIKLRATATVNLQLGTGAKPGKVEDVPGIIEVSRIGGTLMVVGVMDIESYVAGVVQAEAGKDKPSEYYKLQAVSCRTYALTNKHRHAGEGFSVCDGTHCQVFHGSCTLSPVVEAVQHTRNMVVVDAGIRLIHATFHSNCGGETMNAEDVWSKREVYLVSALDPYCQRSTHAIWQRTLSRTEWLAYLTRTFHLDPADSVSVRVVTDFAPQCRSLYFDGARPLIPLEQVRADRKFNSAWFHVRSEGDSVVFEGRGFGHGVGLCQEGAMQMARVGRSFTEILHHYYAEVHLVDLHTLDFFRDEGF
jgi:stage II sporulation protein D